MLMSASLSLLDAGVGPGRVQFRLSVEGDEDEYGVIGTVDGTEVSDESSSDEDDETDGRCFLTHSVHGAALRSLGRVGAPARAWMGAIPSDSNRQALIQDAITLVEREGGQTFWADASEPPRCSLERYALEVLHFHQAAGRDGAQYMHASDSEMQRCAICSESEGNCAVCGRDRWNGGVEWWVQVRRSDGRRPSIKLHWDSDEERKKQTGEHIPPWLATVTYLGDAGAPTLVLPIVADARGVAMTPLHFGGFRMANPPSDKHHSIRQPTPSHTSPSNTCRSRDPITPVRRHGAFLSFPRAGKHLAFDGRLLHGAPAELSTTMLPIEMPKAAADAHDENVTDIEREAVEGEYVRVSILVNLWAGHKPVSAALILETAKRRANNHDRIHVKSSIERCHCLHQLGLSIVQT